MKSSIDRGQWLKKLIRYNPMNKTESEMIEFIARKIKVSEASVNNWLNGKSMQESSWLKLSAAFGCMYTAVKKPKNGESYSLYPLWNLLMRVSSSPCAVFWHRYDEYFCTPKCRFLNRYRCLNCGRDHLLSENKGKCTLWDVHLDFDKSSGLFKSFEFCADLTKLAQKIDSCIDALENTDCSWSNGIETEATCEADRIRNLNAYFERTIDHIIFVEEQSHKD
jgi:hypothetical protein